MPEASFKKEAKNNCCWRPPMARAHMNMCAEAIGGYKHHFINKKPGLAL